MSNNTYQTFKEFYPYYLSEHKHPVNKSLHLLGTILGIIIFLILMTNSMYVYFPLKNQHIILLTFIRKIVVMSFYMHKLHTQKGEL